MIRAKDTRITTASDVALGAFGWGLAVASASFGVYMTMRAPAHGPSSDFPVFAQLAPRSNEALRPHIPSKTDELDLAATASILTGSHPDATSQTASDAVATAPIVPGIVLRDAGADAAEVAVDGRMQKVRVGDSIPGAGKVLAIYPGPHPMLKTSRGLIVSAVP